MITRFGQPWHGQINNGVLTLPTGRNIAVPAEMSGQPVSGDTWYVNLGAVDPGVTADESAAGMRLYGDVVLFGDGKRYSPLSLLGLGPNTWPWKGPSGKVWLLTATCARSAKSYLPGGMVAIFAQIEVSAAGVGLLHSEEVNLTFTEVSNADAPTPGSIYARYPLSHSPSGAVAMLHCLLFAGNSISVWRITPSESGNTVNVVVTREYSEVDVAPLTLTNEDPLYQAGPGGRLAGYGKITWVYKTLYGVIFGRDDTPIVRMYTRTKISTFALDFDSQTIYPTGGTDEGVWTGSAVSYRLSNNVWDMPDGSGCVTPDGEVSGGSAAYVSWDPRSGVLAKSATPVCWV